MKHVIIASAAIVIGIGVWLAIPDPGYDWPIEEPIPIPDVPVDNPMSEVKVELGRRLFYDTRLSINGSTACATCHLQPLAFTDAKPRSVGATGELHPRSSMSLVNVAYASRLTWANNLLDKLEDQALTPLLGDFLRIAQENTLPRDTLAASLRPFTLTAAGFLRARPEPSPSRPLR